MYYYVVIGDSIISEKLCPHIRHVIQFKEDQLIHTLDSSRTTTGPNTSNWKIVDSLADI